MKSIKEPVTEDYLLEFIDRDAWRRPVVDHELMPPPNLNETAATSSSQELGKKLTVSSLDD